MVLKRRRKKRRKEERRGRDFLKKNTCCELLVFKSVKNQVHSSNPVRIEDGGILVEFFPEAIACLDDGTQGIDLELM